MKILTFSLYFCSKQALKPCPDCRSRDSAQIRQIESSPNPNLTDLVTKQGCGSTATWWLRPRLMRLNGNLVVSTTIVAAQRRLGGYEHGNGYDDDCCGSTAAWWLRSRQRLRPRLLGLNDGGHYDVGDGDDCGGHGHDC